MTARDDLARCERCGGSGWDIDTVHRPYAEECPDCHGTCTQPAAAPPAEGLDEDERLTDEYMQAHMKNYDRNCMPWMVLRECIKRGTELRETREEVRALCDGIKIVTTEREDLRREVARLMKRLDAEDCPVCSQSVSDAERVSCYHYECEQQEGAEVNAERDELRGQLREAREERDWHKNEAMDLIAKNREAREALSKQSAEFADSVAFAHKQIDDLRREVERLHENRKESERDYTDLRDREDALRVSHTALLEAAKAARKQMKHGHERTRDKRGCLACKAIRTIDSAIARAKHGGK